MKAKFLVLCLVVTAVQLLIGTAAFAEERVLEEQIVLKDPTVAQPKKFLVGASYEMMYNFGPYTKYDNTGAVISDGSYEGILHGGNFFLGYDSLTMQVTYRGGDWDIDNSSTRGYATIEKQEQTELEITLRYLFKVSKHFNPYVLAGYNGTQVKTSETMLTPGWTWRKSGTNVVNKETDFQSFITGIGAIVPINKYVGLRADGRLAATSAETTYSNAAPGQVAKVTGSGIGGGAVGTAYLNIWEGLNLQAGGKYLYLGGGDAGWYSKGGIFTMLGYSQRF